MVTPLPVTSKLHSFDSCANQFSAISFNTTPKSEHINTFTPKKIENSENERGSIMKDTKY